MNTTKEMFDDNNTVSHRIEFDCGDHNLEMVMNSIAEKDIFRQQFLIDFNKIIPKPNYLYPYETNEDDDDFMLTEQWCLKYWGTEREAFNSGTVILNSKDNLEYKKVIVFFDTLFTEKKLIPYNIIVGISHLLKCCHSFIHKYYVKKNEIFWGIEKWSLSQNISFGMIRTEKRFKIEDDLIKLRKEFLDTDTLIELLVSERSKQKNKKNNK